MSIAPHHLHPETAPEAAGYIRVSRKLQAEGHSPEIQREAITRLAAQEGFALTMIEEDHERGSKITRAGYQRIIAAVRQGAIGAVIVSMHDRWGRDGVEWLERAREFDRLGVPIISVQEGRDEGGLMRFVRAGMAQWYSEQLAKRTRPAREKAAREGIHCGSTPYGYRRVYPAWDGRGRRPPGRLEPDEAAAGVVRTLYERYAAGRGSLCGLTTWLNGDSAVPPPRRGGPWNDNSVRGILTNPVYVGLVRYNRDGRGQSERCAPGSEFVVPGHHDALITQEFFDAVQARLHGAAGRATFTRIDAPVPLAAGLLRCSGCGAVMLTCRHRGGRDGQYICSTRTHNTTCAQRGYQARAAHAALLAELKRLRHHPWTLPAQAHLLGPDGERAAQAAALRRALDQERDAMVRLSRRMAQMIDDPTDEDRRAFASARAEITARIRSLEAQLEDSRAPAVDVEALRALHERFSRTPLAAIAEQLDDQRDEEGLRELARTLVAEAHEVERTAGRYCRWMRLEVTWTRDVQTLLGAGLLWLEEPGAAPRLPTRAERRRAEYLRRKERVAGVVPALRRVSHAAGDAQPGLPGEPHHVAA